MKPDHTLPANMIFRPAIYGWRRDGKYLYIGQSILPWRRIKKNHHVIKELELLRDDCIDIWFCCDSELDRFEGQLIRHFRPPLNKYIPGEPKPINNKRIYNTFKEAAESKVITKSRIKKNHQQGNLKDLIRIIDYKYEIDTASLIENLKKGLR